MSDEIKNEEVKASEEELAEELNEEVAQEVKEPEKKQSLNDEIKEFNKEHGVTLDAPIVVHKKGDASYEENTEAYEMNETHTGEARPTLVRHRFKKEKKSTKKPYIIIGVIVVFAAVFAALYYTGNITFGPKETTTKPTTESTTVNLQEKYKGTIVVKGTYIFVNGVEVDGIKGLQDELKYEDASPTAFEIIVEDENTEFLNLEVLALLENMGFFTDKTTVTHLDKTGLMAADEQTTQAETTAATAVETTAAPQSEATTG